MNRLLLVFLFAIVISDEEKLAVDDPAQAPVAPAPAEQVAQELLRLQREMGGSVVTDEFDPNDSTEYAEDLPWSENPASHQVNALREAAWQVEHAAHRLEAADLFRQADAIRTSAGQLRHLARKLRREQIIDRTPPGH